MSLTCGQNVEDARLVLGAGRVCGEAQKRTVVKRGQWLVGQDAGRRTVVVAASGYFYSLGRVVEEPFVSKFRTGVGFHLTGDFHILGPRDAKVARQSRLADGRICFSG